MRHPPSQTGLLFAGATLAPAALIFAGLVWSPWLLTVALIYMSLFAFAADEAFGALASDTSHDDWLIAGLPRALAMIHAGVLGAAALRLPDLWQTAPGATLAGFGAAGLWLGTLSTANAHELIHRPDRLSRGLGRWVFISIGFGHHVSAHLLVHHVHVATAQDPNSAPRGRGFYRFAVDAWFGSVISGYRAEARRAHPTGSPFVIYGLGALVFGLWFGVLGGWPSVLCWAALSTFATLQLLMSDYVQHYGLRREISDDGRMEPAGDAHSWTAHHWFTSLLTLNAARHADHHANPLRPYNALRLPHGADARRLPYSIPVMALIALWPAYWRRLVDPLIDGAEAQPIWRRGAGTDPVTQDI